jgi:hypothetical protein
MIECNCGEMVFTPFFYTCKGLDIGYGCRLDTEYYRCPKCEKVIKHKVKFNGEKE